MVNIFTIFSHRDLPTMTEKLAPDLLTHRENLENWVNYMH